MTGKGLKDILQSAVQLNKDHQYALNVYTERLEAELAAVDKLLNAAEYEEEESHLDIAGCIQVSGATRPMGLLSATDLLSQDSPFYDDAIRRQRFLGLTEYHPMKHKELESLAEAVRLENRRLRAYETQRRGEHSFASQYSMSDLESTEGLDWERIADKVVTDSSAISQRSARECEIRWLGDRHPRFNHSSWPSSEIAAAKALVQGHEGGNIDWVSIAEQLGTRRTPIDVMRHAIVRKTHVWDAESDRRLVEAVQKFGTESWSLVARLVSEDAQPNSCQNRWYRSLDPSIRRGNWSPEEDAQLRLAVNLYGHAWMEVASVIPGRNNEQCRDRWTERLNPKVTKGKWTTEEDARLLSAVSEFGVGKWKEVSERIGTGRTDNTCRYRYDVLKSDSQGITSRTNEAQGLVTSTAGPPSSKARQRSRKGKERALESSARDSAQNDDASRKPQTRSRKGRKAHAKNGPGDPEVIGHDAALPQVDSQLPPVETSKKPRPKARPLNRARTQIHATSDPVQSPQNVGPSQPTISEAVPPVTFDSAHASTPRIENEDTREDTRQLSRKRPTPASRDLNYADKRQKISHQRLTVDTVGKGVDSSLTDDVDMDSAVAVQVNAGLSVEQDIPAATPKSRSIRGKKVTSSTRIQPKRSSRS